MLKLPRIVSRTFRSITEADRFHAYEWKYILLLGLFPTLTGILGPKYLVHFLKLGEAIHILCSTSISTERLNKAEDLLKSYVIEFEEIYGKENMVFNVHLLLHTADCVRKNGPLFGYSNYSTEDNLGHLVSFVKGTTDAVSQITNRYMLERNLFFHLQRSAMAKDYFKHIECQHFKNVTKIGQFLLVGKSQFVVRDKNIQEKLQQLHFAFNDETKFYRAVFINLKVYFETVECAERKMTNDSFICIPEENIFGNILYVVVKGEEVFFVIKNEYEIKTNGRKISTYVIELDKKIANEYLVISSVSVRSKFALCITESLVICSEFPNIIERN